MTESGLPDALAGENVIRDLRLVDLPQDRERGLAERDAMLARRLHALGRDGPDLGVKVDLRPSRAENFAGSSRRQDSEFQRQPGHGLALAELGDKAGNVLVAHGRMMAARKARRFGQQVLKVSAPCGGVLARPVALGLGRVEDALDASAEPRGGLRFRLPDRSQNGENVCRLDLVDGLGAQRLGVHGQRHAPLRLVLLVAEALGQVAGDLVGKLAEGRDAFAFLAGSAIGSTPLRASLRPAKRLLAGVGETDFRVAAQAHFARPALPQEAQNPFLRPAGRDGQLQPRRRRRTCPASRSRPCALSACPSVGPQVSPQI